MFVFNNQIFEALCCNLLNPSVVMYAVLECHAKPYKTTRSCFGQAATHVQMGDLPNGFPL